MAPEHFIPKLPHYMPHRHTAILAPGTHSSNGCATFCAAVGQMVYQAAHAWKAKGQVAAGTRDENPVNLPRPHEGLLKQLPLRVLAAVK